MTFKNPCAALLLGVTALLIGGCATPSRVSLDPAKKAGIRSTECVVGLQQQELGADIKQSNITQATGGGLLFALIDAGINNSRAKTAEQDVVPVRDALIGYDLGQTLKTDLNNALALTPWLQLREIDVRQIRDEETVKSWLAQSKGDALLLVRPYYRLNSTFDSLTVSLGVYLQARADQTDVKKPTPPIYFNSLSCVTPLPGIAPGNITREDAARLWAEDSGRKVRQAMDEGLAELARLLAYDLEQSNPPDKKIFKAPENAAIRIVAVPYAPGALEGYVTRTENGREWVRLPSGELYSLRK